jgi:hypothetical protein
LDAHDAIYYLVLASSSSTSSILHY